MEPIGIVADVSGHWLRRYAEDFLAAAQAFRPPKNRFSPVRYYLICHSIELALKAYLFTTGFNRLARKDLNHNLVKALQAAENNGLAAYFQITQQERETVEKANELYPKKEFEYFESLQTIYDPHKFDLDVLEGLAQRLIQTIEAPVNASVIQ